MKYYQQGDVLLVMVNETQGKLVEGHDGVLARGEATGHTHTIEDLCGIGVYEKDGVFYVSAEHPFTVRHQEHRAITVPAGKYRLGRVREYDHFAEEARNVTD